MVEEHSTDLTSRIDSDYPHTNPAPVPSSACLVNEIKLVEPTPASSSSFDVNCAKSSLSVAGDEVKINDCDVDNKFSDNKNNYKSNNRPNSIEARKSKSLSVELEDVNKKDVKKTKSNPVVVEDCTAETEKIENDTKETEMTIEESASPLKDSRSSLETRSDSPKPGCSSQPDMGMFL